MPERSLRKLLGAALALSLPFAAGAQYPLSTGNAPGPVSAAAIPTDSGFAPVATRSAAILDPNRKLQPGDVLSFRIYEDKDPAVSVPVRPTGDIVVDPLDHAIHVAGLTPAGAAAELKRQLEKDFYYTATVRLDVALVNDQATIGRAYLSGAINRPGEFRLPADHTMKLGDVITAAGGFAKFADDRKVKLTRIVNGVPQVYTIDVKEILSKSRVDLDMDVKDGDRVVVKETFFQPR